MHTLFVDDFSLFLTLYYCYNSLSRGVTVSGRGKNVVSRMILYTIRYDTIQ